MSDDLQQKLWVIFQAEAREHLECVRRHVQALEGKPDPRGPLLDEAFRRAHSLKGAARAVGISPIETLGHRLETLFSRVRENALALDASMSVVIHRVLDAMEDDMAARAQGKTPEAPRDALAMIDHLLAPAAAPALVVEPLVRPVSRIPEDKVAGDADETVRIHTRHLDRLRRLSGELLTEGIRQQGNASHQGARIFRRLGHQLQEEVRQISKVPAESLFHGFRKMVRDLAHDENKEIECRVIGLDTEADQRVLQALKDPVMHLLRNAISHGIEKSDQRIAAGKKPAAMVLLRLELSGHRLHLSIEDDGRGVDWKKISATAVHKGLFSESQAAQASATELTSLLFQPGFSTASTITDLSGRGMGLSIVREAVLRLQGDIQVSAREGGGSVFHISVPVSDITYRLLLVRVKDQTLAIPVHAIERVLQVPLSDIESLKGNPTMALSGRPVPLYPLAHLLKMADVSLHVDGHKIPVLVLKDSTQHVALAVDGFLAEQEGVVVDLGRALSPLRALLGGLVISDGSVVCVLNPAELLRLGAEQGMGPSLTVEKPLPKKKTPHILIVDDSITTRTLEKSILEAHGYSVRLAVDGLDALEKLKAERADLAIVDIEMPRMDGFTLVGEMKKDPVFSKIPIVMVTSLETKKDKERGFAAGVEAYIVKGKFDHQSLLETIRQLL